MKFAAFFMFFWFHFVSLYMLRSTTENAHWAKKPTTTRCGTRETATTRCGCFQTTTTRCDM